MSDYRSCGLADLLREGEAWRAGAACVGQNDLFFARDEGKVRSLATAVKVAAAKRICMIECPVQENCLEWALANRVDDGVWGGYDEQERRALVRQRRKDAQLASA